ncbi:50S ribosomal protein L14e [Candidatus Thorarchaeota archaeon]|jgi:large subunit ribosomal protein L14e|nr:MAG: 50S ribosomal protein L14e [Candidatus Thorarchaeota archaeon]
MALYEVGRVCVKTMGREAGSYCVVVETEDDSFVVVTGPKHISGVRRRSCNPRHLEPLDHMLPIKSGDDDEAVEKAIEEAGLSDLFREKVRVAF